MIRYEHLPTVLLCKKQLSSKVNFWLHAVCGLSLYLKHASSVSTQGAYSRKIRGKKIGKPEERSFWKHVVLHFQCFFQGVILLPLVVCAMLAWAVREGSLEQAVGARKLLLWASMMAAVRNKMERNVLYHWLVATARCRCRIHQCALAPW